MTVDPCRRAAEMMWAFLDGEIDDAAADELRIHIDACAACLEHYDAEIIVRTTLRRCCAESAPASLRARITTLRIERG